MQEEEIHHKAERLVRFGSIISLNLKDHFDNYIFCEGFMDELVELKEFNNIG